MKPSKNLHLAIAFALVVLVGLTLSASLIAQDDLTSSIVKINTVYYGRGFHK